MTADWVTTQEASALLGIGYDTLYRCFCRGDLATRRYGAGATGAWSYLYQRDEVQALAKRRRCKGAMRR